MIRRAALLAACLCAAAARAEVPGAATSRSVHEPGEPAETEESEHRPRHGGFFGDADDRYHYEVLLEAPGRLILYVNDEHNQPLDVRALQGRWTLNPDAPHPVSGVFAPSADGTHFVAVLPPLQADPVHVKVAVPRDGVWAEMEFFLPAPPLP